MKVQVLSDLHIERMRDSDKTMLDIIPATDADVIALAGDIGVGFEEESEFCRQLSIKHDKQVLFVLGNHSFYGYRNVDTIRQQWYDADINGVQYLDEGISFVKDGINFVGGIFWTDFNDYNNRVMAAAEHTINDYRGCCMTLQDSKNSGRQAPYHPSDPSQLILTPARTVDEHIKTKEWIDLWINDSNSGKNVVISHHSPSTRSTAPEYVGDIINPAFCSDLDDWIKERDVSLWIHGHCHNSSDYYIGDTRVVCNPYGYYANGLNYNCDLGLVIEVDVDPYKGDDDA
jgi:Icc-related predicted phosphoesterase